MTDSGATWSANQALNPTAERAGGDCSDYLVSESSRFKATSENQDFSPVQVIEVELTEPLKAINCDDQYKRMLVLGRLYSEPIGTCFMPLSQGGITPHQLAAALWRAFGKTVKERYEEAGFASPTSLSTIDRLPDPHSWPFLHNRTTILASAPFISVIICTRERPQQLQACLRRLGQQDYPSFETIVVDNAPTTTAVRSLVDNQQSRGRCRYILEQRPGLSWARNAGVASASAEIIAFLDDDDEPDKYWLAGLASGFAINEDVGCVTGPILPARLDTAAQELFEQLGGHNSGRGFSRAIFSRSSAQSPLYPLPPFGTGANMAFRRTTLRSIGGFDVALGAGTPAAAGEDTLALTLALLSGFTIIYEPSALMWHHHRQDLEGLSRQLHGYSIGLTAFYTALLRHRPTVLPGLLRLLPNALRYLRNATTTPHGERPHTSAVLDRRHLQGLLIGPLAYLSSMRRQARIASHAIPPEVL